MTAHVRIPDREPAYAAWLHTCGRKPQSALTWYISPITKMHEKGITDEDFLSCEDVDDLIVRYRGVSSIWEVENGKKRTYLRNTIKHYRTFLIARAEGNL